MHRTPAAVSRSATPRTSSSRSPAVNWRKTVERAAATTGQPIGAGAAIAALRRALLAVTSAPLAQKCSRPVVRSSCVVGSAATPGSVESAVIEELAAWWPMAYDDHGLVGDDAARAL
eukprot:6741950-Prymnesium_polylepis.1